MPYRHGYNTLAIQYKEEEQESRHLVVGQGQGDWWSANRGFAARASHASRRRSMPEQPSPFLAGEGLKLCNAQSSEIAHEAVMLRLFFKGAQGSCELPYCIFVPAATQTL